MRRHRVLLLVDLSYQTYRATAGYPHLTSADGEFTGGVYGFLVLLAKFIREVDATDIVVCQDCKPYIRSKLYPEYKLIRKKSQDDDLKRLFDQSTPMVLEALDCIGIPVLGLPGFESDDVIGHLVVRERHRFTRIVASSNDSDLFALFGVCRTFMVGKGADDLADIDTLYRDTGLTPQEFSLASALMGTHNDIEGIPRVGIKTAVKAVKDPGLLRTYRERYSQLIDRNLALIKLPHAEFPRDTPLPPPLHRFDHRALYKWAARYDIQVTTSMVDSFSQVCP